MISVGAVVIGRNEGERLHRCLESIAARMRSIIYVDSGSSDGSPELARGMGFDVLELDLSTGFTAARARNEGLRRLLSLCPDLQFVQFVDGDCELREGWLATGAQVLASRPDVAIVAGRVRERHPENSCYNRLCDMEWNTPAGEVEACGGIFMARISAFQAVGGFSPHVIAGEEPELCLRLRQAGWKILRLDAEMVLHDAQMMRFGQWWKRATRGGHSFAEHVWMHGRAARSALRQVMSMLLWAILLPAVALGPAWPTRGLSLLLLAGYALLWLRVYRRKAREGLPRPDARLYATFILIGKFAALQGAVRFLWRRLWRRQSTIIEYKAAPAATSK